MWEQQTWVSQMFICVMLLFFLFTALTGSCDFFLLGLFSIPSTGQLALLWNISLNLPLQCSSIIECSGLLVYVRNTNNSLIKIHLEVKPVHLWRQDILEQLHYFSLLHPSTQLHPFVHSVFGALSVSQFLHEKFISEITVRHHFLKEVSAGDWTLS